MNVLSNLIITGMLGSVIFGAIYVGLWLSQRTTWAYLFFSFSAFSVGLFAAIELGAMHSTSIDEFVKFRHFAQMCSLLIIVFFALFLKFYLRSGRLWLFLLATVIRTASLVIDQLSPFSINYKDIVAIRHVSIWGESISVADGTLNPLMIIAQLGLVLYLLFCADATVSVWRRGERRLALSLGGGVILFSTGSLIAAILTNWKIIDAPLIVSPFFMGVVVIMGYELTWRVIQSQKLSIELEKERADSTSYLKSLGLAAAAGNVGTWVREIESGTMFVSNTWREIFGFTEDEELSHNLFANRIHPADRDRVMSSLEQAVLNLAKYEMEYRIVLPDGQLRWIHSKGIVEEVAGNRCAIYGASADVTKLRIAENAAHELSGRLIEAQETERARLARELHDDLSQRLALLSIEIDTLANKSNSAEPFENRISVLSRRIQHISSDIHRISHTLHPALLQQLGLIPAINEFCREMERAHGLEINFTHVPLEVPDDVALCLFRVTQESLQNVAKHSGSEFASVDLALDGNEVCLSITDEGRGFDPDSQIVRDSLGLVSMQERMRAVRGSLNIDSSPGSGTRIVAKIPLSKGARSSSVSTDLHQTAKS